MARVNVQEFNERVEAVWRGSIDVHVHAAPDPTAARRFDALDMALAAHAAGMRGVIFKSHEHPTIAAAHVLNRVVAALPPPSPLAVAPAGPFTVFGAISLDDEVGGLNPRALEASARMGAAIVWMPTFSADYWSTTHSGRPGIKVLDEHGGLIPVVHQIIDLVLEHDMILATGHLWAEEQLALVKAARARDVKTVVTHADMWIPIEMQAEMARLGAFIEHAYIGCLPTAGYYTVERVAEAVRAAGVSRSILSTDLGQAHNPAPAEGLRAFIAAMMRSGFSDDEVARMVKGGPAELLGIA